MTRALLFSLALLGSAGALSNPTAAPPARADDALLRAYQKELAVLVAEKRELTRRLDEQRRKAADKRETAERELRAAEDALVALTLRADRAEERLADLEREGEATVDGRDALQGLLAQAASEQGREPPREVTADGLRAGFKSSLSKTTNLAAMRREAGTWFDEAGREVEGTVLRLGAVAAFGKGPASGALAPAGADRLRIWPESDPAEARAVVDGRAAGALGLFLFESTDTAVEPPQSKTLGDVLEAGGLIGYVIVALGFMALLLALARALLLLARGRAAGAVLASVSLAVERGRVDEALARCGRTPGSMARVLEAALRARGRTREERADLVDETLLDEAVAIDRFGSMVLVAAGVAPLLGLLGTVTGMIGTFDAITEHGTGDPRLLSGGISEALVTTELGLLVAIPALLLGNLLSGVAERLHLRLEAGALRVGNLLDGDRPPPARACGDDDDVHDDDEPSLGALVVDARAGVAHAALPERKVG